MDSEITRAIRNKNQIQFYYDGGNRIVEPHCYGITTAGNEGLRAFQVGGYSGSGKMGWKLFALENASSIEVLEETFSAPRSGYLRGDKGMSQIFDEL